MRRLLFLPALVLGLALLSCDGYGPTEPETEAIAAEPLLDIFENPPRILIEDYDLVRMQFKYSRPTGMLTVTVTFKNMSKVPCHLGGSGLLGPAMILDARPAGSWFFGQQYVVTRLCDEPGGSGESVKWTFEAQRGLWQYRARLMDGSPDDDVILRQYTVK
jgi:hypothetical protein